jgi:hypothetical protein
MAPETITVAGYKIPKGLFIGGEPDHAVPPELRVPNQANGSKVRAFVSKAIQAHFDRSRPWRTFGRVYHAVRAGVPYADCNLESFNPATEELLGLRDSSQQSASH